MKKGTSIGAFEFVSSVNAAGYEWKRGRGVHRYTEPTESGVWLQLEKVPKPQLGWFLVPRAVPGSATNPCRPLEDSSGLFRDFAQLSPDREAILKFANTNGPLLNLPFLVKPLDARSKLKRGERPLTPGELLPSGERLEDWTAAIRDMKSLVDLWAAIVDRDTDALLRFVEWDRERVLFVPPSSKKGAVLASSEVRSDLFARLRKYDLLLPARVVLRWELNERMKRSSATTKPDLLLTPDMDVQLALVPSNLLAALWLQFAQAFAANYKLQRCRGCGRFFQVGAGSNRRADATTCTEACRQRAYRREANGGRSK